MVTRIGILSDTHLPENSDHFRILVDTAFTDCKTIIHAGDLTDYGILEAFKDKEVYAVHGNMCSMSTRQKLPESLVVTIAGYRIAVCHGAGLRSNIEDRLFDRFSDMDCVVYGHTHQPVSHYIGSTLFVNPGSFQSTGPYGYPGSYGMLVLEEKQISARLYALQVGS